MRAVAHAGEREAWVGTDENHYVVRLQERGHPLWTQPGRGTTQARGMAVTWLQDGSFAIVGAGVSNGDGNWDVLVARYTADGTQQWEARLASPQQDLGYAIASHGDRIFVAGMTRGALPGQQASGSRFRVPGPDVSDAFVAAFALDGRPLWTRQFGTREGAEGRIGADEARDLATGPDGSVYVVGMTSGALHGQRSFGIGGEAFVTRFGPDGRRGWTRLLGRRSAARAVAVTRAGDVAVVGASNVFSEGSFVALYDTRGRKRWEHWQRPAGSDVLFEAQAVVANAGQIHVLAQRAQETDGQAVHRGVQIFRADANGLSPAAEHPTATAWDLSVGEGGMFAVGEEGGASRSWRVEGGQLVPR